MGCVVSHRKSRLFKPPKQQEGKMQGKKKVERIVVMCYCQRQSLCQDFWDLPSQTAFRAQKYHLELPRMVWMTDIQSTPFKYCLFALCKQHWKRHWKNSLKNPQILPPDWSPWVQGGWLCTPSAAASLCQGNKTRRNSFACTGFSPAFMPGHAQDVQGLKQGGEGINSIVIFYHLVCLSCFSSWNHFKHLRQNYS